MASEVEICNLALVALGESVIIALSDTTKAGRLCSLMYEPKRDWLLRKYEWKFATRRVTLAADSATPNHEWSHQFTLPTDCEKFIAVYPDTVDYAIEGNKILCEETTLYIKYTQRITDPNVMDSTFREALTYLMARELAIPIADSHRKMEKMDELFEDKLGDARFAGSIEDDLEEVGAEDWLYQRI